MSHNWPAAKTDCPAPVGALNMSEFFTLRCTMLYVCSGTGMQLLWTPRTHGLKIYMPS
jgi:hypothetical protein